MSWQGGIKELRESQGLVLMGGAKTEIVRSGRPGDDKVRGIVLGVGS